MSDSNTPDKDGLGIPSVLNEENTGEGGLSAYERWELPLMEGENKGANNAFIARPRPASIVIEEGEEEIKPLTAEEVEAVRQAAYEEGLAQGVEAGNARGYDEGYKSGADDIRSMMTKLSQICRALLEPIPSQDEEIEQALMELVKSICSRVVHRELELDSSNLRIVLKEALDCLQPGARRLRIHLNPDDAGFIQQALEEMSDLEFNWQLLPHQTISPGGCIVETDKSMVDARSEKRLAAIIEKVYRKEDDALEEVADTSNSGLEQLLGEVERFENAPSIDANSGNHPAANDIPSGSSQQGNEGEQ